jgi:hypothetical protein
MADDAHLDATSRRRLTLLEDIKHGHTNASVRVAPRAPLGDISDKASAMMSVDIG